MLPTCTKFLFLLRFMDTSFKCFCSIDNLGLNAFLTMYRSKMLSMNTPFFQCASIQEKSQAFSKIHNCQPMQTFRKWPPPSHQILSTEPTKGYHSAEGMSVSMTNYWNQEGKGIPKKELTPCVPSQQPCNQIPDSGATAPLLNLTL